MVGTLDGSGCGVFDIVLWGDVAVRGKGQNVDAFLRPNNPWCFDQRTVARSDIENLNGITNRGDPVTFHLLKHDRRVDQRRDAVVAVSPMPDTVPIHFVSDVELAIHVSERRRVNGTPFLPWTSQRVVFRIVWAQWRGAIRHGDTNAMMRAETFDLRGII